MNILQDANYDINELYHKDSFILLYMRIIAERFRGESENRMELENLRNDFIESGLEYCDVME